MALWTALAGLLGKAGSWLGSSGSASSVLGSGLSGAFNMFSANDQQESSSHLMEKQGKINAFLYQNRYQWMVDDMIKAGLNPILAASGGFSAGSSPSVGLPMSAQAAPFNSTMFSSTARDYAAAERDKQELDRIKADTQKKLKEIELVRNQAKESLERAAQSRAQQKLLSAQEKQALANINKIDKEIQQMSGRIVLMRMQTLEAKATGELQSERKSEVRANVGKINKEMSMLDLKVNKLVYELKQLQKVSNVYGGPIGQWIAYTDIIRKALGITPVALLKGGKK